MAHSLTSRISLGFSMARRRSVLFAVLGLVLLAGAISTAKASGFLSGFSYALDSIAPLGKPADMAERGVDFSGCPYAPCSSCISSECTVPARALSRGARISINLAIDAFEQLVETYLDQIKVALTKLANQGSNNTQNFTNSVMAGTDAVNTSLVADSVSQSRVLNTASMVPSASACRLATRDRTLMNADILMRVGAGGVGSGAMYTQSQRDGTDYASNRPGGPSGNGALQAAKNTFDESLNGFCDNTVLRPPSGMSCTLSNDREGRPMAFRYSQPFAAVFGVKDDYIPSNSTDPENRAARLFVRYAIEPVPTDSVRGSVLARSDGRSSYLVRQSDISAMNLARGALDHMVDDRIENPTLGASPTGSPQSLQSVRMLAWADYTPAFDDAQRGANLPLGSNYDDLGPLVGDVNKIYLQLFNNLERLAAIKATRLARLVKQAPAGGASVSTRTIRN